MDSVLATPPSLTDQRAVTEQVLITLANITTSPGEMMRTDFYFTEDPLISSLHYAAPSNQFLLLECSPQLAFHLTACLFDRPKPTLETDEDVVDALAELVNTIGGNLKALMSPQTCISLPSVLQRRDAQALTESARQLSKMCLPTIHGMLCLTFFEQTQDM